MLTQEQFNSLRVGDQVIIDIAALMEVSRRYAEVNPQVVLRADFDVHYIDDGKAIAEYNPYTQTWYTIMSTGDCATITETGMDAASSLAAGGGDEKLPMVRIDTDAETMLILVEEEAMAALTLV